MTLCLVSATDSCNVMLSRTSVLASPLESAVTKNASAKRLESALTKSLDLKPPGINSYKKTGGSLLLFAFAPFTFCPFPFRLPPHLSVACHLWYISGRKEDFNTSSTKNAEHTEKKVQ